MIANKSYVGLHHQVLKIQEQGPSKLCHQQDLRDDIYAAEVNDASKGCGLSKREQISLAFNFPSAILLI